MQNPSIEDKVVKDFSSCECSCLASKFTIHVIEANAIIFQKNNKIIRIFYQVISKIVTPFVVGLF